MFGIYQSFHEYLLEPQQSNLNNPESKSEPCQTSKMGCFAEIANG